MITIITVYKSNNYGSFLQALALGDILHQFDDDIRYLDFGQRHYFDIQTFRLFWHNMSPGNFFQKIKFIVVNALYNFIAWRKLKSISIKNAGKIKNNLFMIGSDEIWNVSRNACRNPIFWGDKCLGKKISYAPSINNAKISSFQNIPVAKYLNSIDSISVRDSYSKKILSAYTNKDIEVTLDPTMLFNADYYREKAALKPLPFKYAVLYIFPEGNEFYKKIIQRFAKEKKLKLVSIGTYLSWCDVNITANDCTIPFLYYIDAEFVFANTFHGTAFAINFEKDFFTFAKNEKIETLLKTFDLYDRNIMDLEYETIVTKSAEKIDYKKTNEIKSKLREHSLNFLKKSIQTINRNGD